MVYGGCLDGFVWAENIGYIHLRAPAASTCGDIQNTTKDNYGVTVDGSDNCAGYGWSETVGWISFSCENTASCGVADFGVTLSGTVPNRRFEGYAWAENVGYIHFRNSSPAYEVRQVSATNVELASFTAEPCPRSGCILLRQQTAAEIDSAGFHLWRSDDGGGHYIRITTTLIPARGSPTEGASYTYEDGEVEPAVRYTYQLEEVDETGASTFHGPVWFETSWLERP